MLFSNQFQNSTIGVSSNEKKEFLIIGIWNLTEIKMPPKFLLDGIFIIFNRELYFDGFLGCKYKIETN